MESPVTDIKYFIPQTFDYKNKDYILLKYEQGQIAKAELYNIFKTFQKQFPNSKIIVLPNNMSIENCGEKELTAIYEMLKEILGK